MAREWSARKTTPLVEGAIDPSDFRAAFAFVREGLALPEARKQVLRLLAAYTLIFLPLQVGVYILAARSVGLAAAISLVLAAALAAIAVARWLGLDELLQKLPLLGRQLAVQRLADQDFQLIKRIAHFPAPHARSCRRFDPESSVAPGRAGSAWWLSEPPAPRPSGHTSTRRYGPG